MAGLSMGGMQTRQITTLANLDEFSHIGIFSGGGLAATDPALANAAVFKQKVKVLFVSYGSRVAGTTVCPNDSGISRPGLTCQEREAKTWEREICRGAASCSDRWEH